MRGSTFFILIQLLFFSLKTLAQFGLPTEECPRTDLNLSNPATTADSWFWDFCVGDLTETPIGQLVSADINAGANTRPEGITSVFDGNNWYAFTINRTTSSLTRIKFGNSLSNSPNISEMPNVDSKLNSPISMEVFQESGNWYGLVVNVSDNGDGAGLVLIDFGSSLDNSPSATSILDAGEISTPVFIEVVKEDNDLKALIVNNNSNIVIANFGNSVLNTPNFTALPAFPFSNARSLQVIEDEGTWYGIVVGNQGYTHHISFGSDIDNNDVTITNITTNISILSPGTNDVVNTRTYGLGLAKDGTNFIALVITSKGNLLRFNFGNTMANQSPSSEDLGRLGVLGDGDATTMPSLAITLENENSNWYALSMNRQNSANPNQLTRVVFPNNCNANVAYSSEQSPTVSFNLSGDYTIRLEGYDNNGFLVYQDEQSVSIKSTTVGQFTFSNQCIGEVTNFQNTSIGSTIGIIWEWDFGDGSTSNESSPSHTFANTGTFSVSLTVRNPSGCDNTITKMVDVVNTSADFNFIGGCTGDEFQFTNNSTLQNTGVVTYRWLLDAESDDGELTFTENPTFTYDTPGSYQVQLSVIDASGCASSITKSIVVEDPLIPDFEFSTLEAGIPSQFTDITQISNIEIATWEWDFGELIGLSNLKNPQITFPEVGSYEVRLRVRNNSGCLSDWTSKTLEVVTPIVTSLSDNIHTNIEFGISELFPNPTQGEVTILYQSQKQDIPITLRLQNLSGKVVYQASILPSQKGENQLMIDFNHLESGLYLLTLEQAGQITIRKILVQ